MKIDKPQKKLGFDPERCERTYLKAVEVFQQEKPTTGEIVVALSNLTYTLGASIEGYTDKGPNLETLQKEYYTNPGKVGISLMLQGLTLASWYNSYQDQVLESIEKRLSDSEEK